MPTTPNTYSGTTPVPYTNTGATPAFLPDTPQFQRGLRSLTDNYNAQLANITAQRSQVGAGYNQQYSRMGTDVGLQRQGLNNAMAARGMYDSSSRGLIDRNQIQMPYGRNLQDLNQQTNMYYGQLSQAEQSANLGYQQGLADLLLDRAAWVSQYQPYGLPQTGPQPRTYQMYDYWYNPQQVTAPYGYNSPYVTNAL